MNIAKQLASHETLELHEIIRSEVTCAKKLQASISLVQDNLFYFAISLNCGLRSIVKSTVMFSSSMVNL